MVKSGIDSIKVEPQKVIPANGGDVFKIINLFDSDFYGFGEAYFTTVLPNHIKGWKKHKTMTLNLVVPIGEVKFVFAEDDAIKFRVENIGSSCYNRITVPPNIWFAFKCVSNVSSLVLNIANIIHDPYEVETCNLDNFNFNW